MAVVLCCAVSAVAHVRYPSNRAKAVLLCCILVPHTHTHTHTHTHMQPVGVLNSCGCDYGSSAVPALQLRTSAASCGEHSPVCVLKASLMMRRLFSNRARRGPSRPSMNLPLLSRTCLVSAPANGCCGSMAHGEWHVTRRTAPGYEAGVPRTEKTGNRVAR